MTISRAAATASFTLNNTGTAVLITGLTLTPGAGDYLLFCTVEHTTSAAAPAETDTFSVWVNNVELAHSRRTYVGNTSIDNCTFTYALTCKVSPGAGEAVEIRHTRSSATEPNIATNREMTLFPIPAAGTDYEDSSSTNDTTSSSTFSTIVGMARTPAAGDYLVIFSSSAACPTASADAGFRISIDGTPEAHTPREIFWESSGTAQELSVMTLAKINVSGSQEVQVEFASLDNSSTITVGDRTMNIIPIASGDIFQATGTVNDTDSTTTDKLIDDMTITDPGAGDYLTMFSITQEMPTIAVDEGRVTYSIHENGAVVTDTERDSEIEDSLDLAHMLAYAGGKVTVSSGTSDLEVFWQGASTVARIGRERTFIAIRELSANREQDSFRFYDDGTEAGATALELQNVDLSIARETTFQVRVGMQTIGDAGTESAELQYKETADAAAEWRKVP